MIEFSCSDFSFPLLSHEKALELISLMDFKQVDIGLFKDISHIQPKDQLDFPAKKGEALRKLTSDKNLKVSDVFMQSSKDFSEYAINHPNPSVRAGEREMFLRAMEYTVSAGCIHFTGLPGVLFDNDSSKICIDELSWRVEQAKQFNVIYAVEPHYGSIMEIPEKALELLNDVPGLRITLDHSHYTAQGVNMECLRPMIRYASHMHARSAAKGEMQTTFSRCETDFTTISKDIKEMGYSGTICLEYCYLDWENCNRTDNVSETIILRRHLAKLLNIAEH